MFLDCNKTVFLIFKSCSPPLLCSVFINLLCFIVSSYRIFSAFMSKTKRKQEKNKLFSSGDYKEMALTTQEVLRDQ